MKIIKREDAIKKGERYYFTGKACPNGHLSKRSVHNRTCYECKCESRRRADKKNKGKRNARVARYHAAKANATPYWANLEMIREVYVNCPDGMEVDHIMPIRGEDVCGLHVAWNLQYLTKSENCSKGNRVV